MHAPFGFLLPSDESSAIGGVVAEQMESAPLLAQGKRKYVPYVDDWCSTPRPLTCSHPAAQPRGRIAFLSVVPLATAIRCFVIIFTFCFYV